MILLREARWWTNIVFWTELRVGGQRSWWHGVGRMLRRVGERWWRHRERSEQDIILAVCEKIFRRYYCASITIVTTWGNEKWQSAANIKFLLLRKPGLGDESCNLWAVSAAAATLLKIGLVGWTGVQYLVTLAELSSNPSSRYSEPELSFGGLILGRTCWKALDPDELELCFKTSSWSLISWTLSWMLLKADFGRELLLFFTAEGNL